MWSVGCIIYEILHTLALKDSKEMDYLNRVLFPGDSSFPLSPRSQDKNEENQLSKNDQLKLIIEKLGPLEHEDICFLTDDEAFEYVAKL